MAGSPVGGLFALGQQARIAELEAENERLQLLLALHEYKRQPKKRGRKPKDKITKPPARKGRPPYWAAVHIDLFAARLPGWMADPTIKRKLMLQGKRVSELNVLRLEINRLVRELPKLGLARPTEGNLKTTRNALAEHRKSVPK